jgi:hypothetical protein
MPRYPIAPLLPLLVSPNLSNFCPCACRSRQEVGTLIMGPLSCKSWFTHAQALAARLREAVVRVVARAGWHVPDVLSRSPRPWQLPECSLVELHDAFPDGFELIPLPRPGQQQLPAMASGETGHDLQVGPSPEFRHRSAAPTPPWIPLRDRRAWEKPSHRLAHPCRGQQSRGLSAQKL